MNFVKNMLPKMLSYVSETSFFTYFNLFIYSIIC